MTTGYFATQDGRRGKVHLVRGTVPVCRNRPPHGFYQECGSGPHLKIVECRKCLRWAATVAKDSRGDGS